jgi:RND family efflux transporter MFP subunit
MGLADLLGRHRPDGVARVVGKVRPRSVVVVILTDQPSLPGGYSFTLGGLTMSRRLSPAPVLVLMLVLVPSRTGTGNPTDAPREVILVRRCTLEYRDATSLGATTSAILQDCPVQVGDRVQAGQVLGRLQDIEQRANVGVAEARYKLAQTRVKTATPLLASRSLAQDEFDVLKGEMDTRRMELELARATVRTREFVSPHEGVVVAVYKKKGETVNGYAGDPVFRVVNPDVLRVTGALDLPDSWRVKPGKAVQIFIEFAGTAHPIKQEAFEGRVVFVDSEIDPKTETCKVIAEVKNHGDVLKSGLAARMEINPRKDQPAEPNIVTGQKSGPPASGKP